MIVLHPHEIEELVESVMPKLELSEEQRLLLFAAFDRAAAIVKNRLDTIRTAELISYYRRHGAPPENYLPLSRNLIALTKEPPAKQRDVSHYEGHREWMQMIDDVVRSITGAGYGGA